VPVRDASLGIVRDEEKLTGGFGPAGAIDWRLLVLVLADIVAHKKAEFK
jgi:hypothetical protein